MEYGKLVSGDYCSQEQARLQSIKLNHQTCSPEEAHLKYIDWDQTSQNNSFIKFLFNPSRLKIYQNKISDLLEGVHPEGKKIVVPIQSISHVLWQCYENRTQQLGDMYSKYHISGIQKNRDDTRDIVDRAINIIVSQIRDEYEREECNKKLTIWTTLYGDFNKHGLRAHPPIKVRKNTSERFQFHMRY
jgi:hypothetical protein